MMKFLKNKKNWQYIIFGLLCVFNLALIIEYIVYGAIYNGNEFETEFAAVGFNTFLRGFTYLFNGVFVLVHVVRLFWKNKTNSLIYILGSAAPMFVLFVARFILCWF